jgi:cytochrome b
VSKDRSNWLDHVHSLNFKLIETVIVLHVLAIVVYAVLKRHDLVRPMVTGTKLMPADVTAPRMVRPAWAVLVLVVAAGVVAVVIRL